MKKLLTLSLITIALLSCKKENNTTAPVPVKKVISIQLIQIENGTETIVK